ncbi:MerR family transcriptional regulator [Sphingomonas sp. CROZ-RG-20F-R02-07]|uniref:MerR family transcriptional regulator n=1 Tax=Sphingomonas sp. CROZ-RG-20F-R02-07 TaxID=2914832 RepID=UPI001F577107|nr:MerR family transcriptional regulator [Sphingomonas sp. CROZ-RG-20F-R02-07]
MEEMLDIGEVARLTGLTLRALRFYKGRGLVAPLRTAGGRRVYGRGELARLNAALALKQAGFSLAEIARLLAGRAVDIGRLVDARLAEIDRRAAAIAEAGALLRTVRSRIDRGEPIDVATLCSLIRTGNDTMEQDDWKAVTDRYMTDEARADFAAARTAIPADFDQAAYAARWKALGEKVEAALPLDPHSADAGALYDEWQALLAPFAAIATPAMTTGITRMYDGIETWKGSRTPPFSSAVWQFIRSVGAARQAA